jgi:hypothetical protein
MNWNYVIEGGIYIPERFLNDKEKQKLIFWDIDQKNFHSLTIKIN